MAKRSPEPPGDEGETVARIYQGLDQAMEAVRSWSQDGAIPEWTTTPLRRQTTAGLGSKGEVFGFQRTIGTDDLDYIEGREPFARTIVEMPADDTWREWFDIKSPSPAFAEAANKLLDSLTAWRYLHTADLAQRRHGMALLYLGLESDPPGAEADPDRVSDVKYLRVITRPEILQIHFDTDPESENFGSITGYTIQVQLPQASLGGLATTGAPSQPSPAGTTTAGQSVQRRISARRVLHLLESNSRRDPWGIPALQVVFDDLQMLKNLKWSSTEAAFRFVVPPILVKFPNRPDPAIKTEVDKQMREFQTGAKQHIKIHGFEMVPLTSAGMVENSEWLYRIIVESIASGAKMPERMLRGSQAGALASADTDERGYYARIRGRQENYAEPLLRELFDRLIGWGLLPEAEYEIGWRPLFTMTEEQKARVDLARAQTARLLASPAGGAAAGPEGAPFPIPGAPQGPPGEPLAPLDFIRRELLRIPQEAAADAARDQRQPAVAPRLTERERELAKKWTLDPEPLARGMAADLQAAIVETEARVVAQVLKALGMDQRLPPADLLRRLLRIEIPVDTFAQALRKHLRAAWNESARATAEALGREDAAALADEDARKWLEAHEILVSETWGAETTQGIKRAVLEGLNMGEGAAQIKRRVSEVWGATDPLRIARTETNRAMNEARVQTYASAGVPRVRLLITEDPITCLICRALRDRFPDGVPVEEAGVLTPPEATHPNCRCTVVPESEFLAGL